MSDTLEQHAVFALAAPNAALCYAASSAGIWRWRAGRAARWKRIAPEFAAVGLPAVAVAGKSIWIGASGDIAVSRDEGASWQLSTLPVRSEVQALAVSPAYDRDGVVLAATARDGVLRSDNGGATFFAWNFGLIDLNINALALSPDFANDGHVIATGDHAVFVSRNGGRAWRELPESLAGAPFTSAAIDVDGTLFVGSETAGLWRAADVASKLTRDVTFKPVTVNALSGDLAAASDGIYRRTRAGWKRLSADDRALCLARCGGSLFAGGAEQGVRVFKLNHDIASP